MARTKAVARDLLARRGAQARDERGSEIRAPPDEEEMAGLLNSVGATAREQRSSSELKDLLGPSSSIQGKINGIGSSTRNRHQAAQSNVPSSSRVSTRAGSLPRIPPARRLSNRLDGVNTGKRKAAFYEEAYALPLSPKQTTSRNSNDGRNPSKRARLGSEGARSSPLPTNSSERAAAPPRTPSRLQEAFNKSLTNTANEVSRITRSMAPLNINHKQKGVSKPRQLSIDRTQKGVSAPHTSLESDAIVGSGGVKPRRGKKKSRQGNNTTRSNRSHKHPEVEVENNEDIEGPQNPTADVADGGEDQERVQDGRNEDAELDGNPQENQGMNTVEEEKDLEFPRNLAAIPVKAPSRHGSNNPISRTDDRGNGPSASRTQNQQPIPHVNNEAREAEEDLEEGIPPDRIRPRLAAEEPCEFHDLVRILVKLLVENSMYIGHTQDEGSRRIIFEGGKCGTAAGKRLERCLDKLAKRYKDLEAAKRAKQSDDALQSDISRLVDQVKKDAGRIMKDELDTPRNGKPEFDADYTKRILIDIYLRLVPRLILALSRGTRTEMPDKELGDRTFKEIFVLVNVLTNLSEVALAQPRDAQPTALPNRPIHQVLEAMKLIVKEERKLRDVMREIQKKKDLATTKEHEEAMQRRFEEEAERRRQKRKLHRAQWVQLRAVLNSDWGRPFPAARESPELGVPQRVWRGQHMTDPDEDGFWNLIEESSDEDDPFADEDVDVHDRTHYRNPQRVHVFGKNNSRNANIPRPWNDREKAHFIEVMRVEKGPDRYINLARDLDRSGEEIFALAKDLQEAMDTAHERGMFNEPCDDWSYEIYVNKRGAAGAAE